jgi:hypothetical protein
MKRCWLSPIHPIAGCWIWLDRNIQDHAPPALNSFQYLAPSRVSAASPEPFYSSNTSQPRVLLGEAGAFYWTVLASDIVNPGREAQGLISMKP